MVVIETGFALVVAAVVLLFLGRIAVMFYRRWDRSLTKMENS
jgi:hypothetical protein